MKFYITLIDNVGQSSPGTKKAARAHSFLRSKISLIRMFAIIAARKLIMGACCIRGGPAWKERSGKEAERRVLLRGTLRTR